jgi:hypothetical protein
MSSQKFLRYSLITAVAIVWGVILYKVFTALNKEEENQSLALPAKAITYAVQKDTFSLLANYSDPFLPFSADTADLLLDSLSTTTVSTTSVSMAKEPDVDVSFIQYLGMISNVEKKNKAAIVSIRGKEVIIREKEAVEGITFKSITTGKISIVYKGKNFNITRQL